MRVLYVIANGYVQFLEYCRFNKVNPHSHMVVYVDDAKKICGVINPNVVFYGTYHDRKDINELKDIIKAHSRPS